ncbi:acetylglutamate kinase [Bacillus subtilis XF-1]|nr:acetylglutamate kinase [Bacillus subtilis XF-1]
MKKTIVFKCGGSVIRELSEEFFQNLKELMASGWKLAIVHGGGPEITNMLKRLNIKTEFSGGQRKTTKPVLEVAGKGRSRCWKWRKWFYPVLSINFSLLSLPNTDCEPQAFLVRMAVFWRLII